MARIELATGAVEDLAALNVTHSLPADTANGSDGHLSRWRTSPGSGRS